MLIQLAHLFSHFEIIKPTPRASIAIPRRVSLY